MAATDLYGLVLGFGIASLGFGFTRPGFTAGASLAVPLGEQGGVAGVVTAANGISYRRRAGIGMLLYAVDPHWPFAVGAALLLGLLLWGRAAARPLSPAWTRPCPAAGTKHAGQDEADPADRPHRVGLQRILDPGIVGQHLLGDRGAGLGQRGLEIGLGHLLAAELAAQAR